MPTEITPVAGYGAYPITPVPSNGDDADAVVYQAILQDIYDRIVYLKDGVDVLITGLAALGIVDANLQSQIDTINISLDTLTAELNNVNTNIGGNVITATPDPFATTDYFAAGASYKTAIESLSDALKAVSLSLDALAPTVATSATDISSLAGKVATSALNGVVGLGISSIYYLSSEKIDTVITAVTNAALTNRRINHQNYIDMLDLWQNRYGAAGYVYDDLIDDTKINGASTANCYTKTLQSFGQDANSWFYYSTAVSIPVGSNYAMFRMHGTGTVYVNFSGSYTSGFVNLPNANTWVAIPAGTNSIVTKVTGVPLARLYALAVAYKTV